MEDGSGAAQPGRSYEESALETRRAEERAYDDEYWARLTKLIAGIGVFLSLFFFTAIFRVWSARAGALSTAKARKDVLRARQLMWLGAGVLILKAYLFPYAFLTLI